MSGKNLEAKTVYRCLLQETGEPLYIPNERDRFAFACGYDFALRQVADFPEKFRGMNPPLRAQLAATPASIARACGLENAVEDAQAVSATNPPKGFALVRDVREIERNAAREDLQW